MNRQMSVKFVLNVKNGLGVLLTSLFPPYYQSVSTGSMELSVHSDSYLSLGSIYFVYIYCIFYS